MTAGEPVAPPLYFRGKQPTGGGAGALTPSPMLPAAAMPPRVEGTGREGICKIHGKAGSQWLGKCILGSHTGAARGEGRALTPSPTFPAAAIPLRIEGTGRERHLQNPWRGGISVAGQMHLGVTHGGSQGRGGALAPYPRFPAAAMPPRAGGIGRERYLQNPWKGGIPVAWQMHLGVTHGGRKGQGRGIGPLTWASRHRRGGLPIRSSEGDRPHMGQGGI